MHSRALTMMATTVLASVLSTASASFAADAKPAALIIAQGGLGDQSYNDLAFAGFKRGVEAATFCAAPPTPISA